MDTTAQHEDLLGPTESTQCDLRRLRKRIKDRERRFKKASPASKRVMIAKDVLSDIATRKLVARSGSWVNMAIFGPSDKELQEILITKNECQVCALGAVFVCAAKRADDITVGEAYGLNHGATVGWAVLDNYLSRFFERDQLILIEQAFEGGGGYFGEYGYGRRQGNGVKGRDRATEFCGVNSSYEDRIVAIMRNIIKNKGEFVP